MLRISVEILGIGRVKSNKILLELRDVSVFIESEDHKAYILNDVYSTSWGRG